MPEHVTRKLVADGTMTTDRVTTTPRVRHCRTCGVAVIAALADDGPRTPGIRVHLDYRPLTPLGELQALVLGLTTYHVTAGSVAWRDPITIARRPADRSVVHHRHVCQPLPPIAYATDHHATTAAGAAPTDPPF